MQISQLETAGDLNLDMPVLSAKAADQQLANNVRYCKQMHGNLPFRHSILHTKIVVDEPKLLG